MAFTAGSSSTWFGVSPAVGNLQRNGYTTIGITSLNMASLPNGRNAGFVIVNAPGYSQTTGLSFSITCGSVDYEGNIMCTYSHSCP